MGITGYDSHCKQLAGALYELNPDIKLDVPLQPDWVRHVNDAELVMINKEARIPDVTIAIMQPQFWRLALADNCKHFIGFCVWEGDMIPYYWLEYLIDRSVDQIWVPSQHTKDAIIKSLEESYTDFLTDEFNDAYLINKIKIVPHGVDLSIFNSQSDNRKGNSIGENSVLDTGNAGSSPVPFVFMCAKGWRGTDWDRGGVQYTIKAFAEEFKKDENVELIVKLNPSYINPEILTESLNNLKLPEDSGDIKLNVDNIPYKELSKFYSQADVHISTTRAEAFNLPCIETMACGIPNIVTGYGGQMDFINSDNGWFIDYKLEEVKEDIQYEEVKWATPKLDDIKKKMRWCFEHQKEVKEKGKIAMTDAQKFTWRNSAKKALEFLNELN